MVVVGTAVAIAASIAAYKAARRPGEAQAAAMAAGLEFSMTDPFECTRVAFKLFRQGDSRGAEHVMWKTRDDNRSVRAFDYWYYDEHRDQHGQSQRSYRYFTCALAQLNGSFPELAIEGEGMLDRVVTRLGLPDQDFESEAFNRTFAVRGPDARFNSALIDPRMIDFLLTTQGRLDFYLKGRWLLVVSPRIEPHLMPALLKVADRFLDHVPAVVWDLYPSNFLDEEGKHLPAGDEFLALEMSQADADNDLDEAWDTLARGPFGVSGSDDEAGEPRVDYDLDGKPFIPREEDPWRDLPPR